MKKFRFQFETVERVRKIKEESALKEFSLAQRKFQNELEIKQKMLKSMEDSMQRRALLASQSASASLLQVEDVFISGTKIRILKQDQQILRARRFLEKAFEVFKKARQASRSIEKLRERAVSDYHALVQKAQSMELDEWSILRGGKGE